MTLLERITQLQMLWQTIMPHIEKPPAEDAALWLEYPDRDIELALLRVAKRFSRYRINPKKFIPQDCYRYMTVTVKTIAERRHERSIADVSRGHGKEYSKTATQRGLNEIYKPAVGR